MVVADIQYTTVNWNHGLSEVTKSLKQILNGAGVGLQKFEEYDYLPYNCFRDILRIEKDKYPIKHLDNKIPMVYAIEGVKV